MPLSESAQAVLRQLAELPSPDVTQLAGDAAADYIAQSRAATAVRKPGEPVAAALDVTVAPTARPSRVYVPMGRRTPAPVLLFFHGGGWVTGSIEMTDDACRYVANRSRCLVISVSYRLAPEHRAPTAAEDAYSALGFAHDNARRWGGDASRLMVAGTSAGGNLAAVVALMARDRGGPPIAEQFLAYPVTDGRMNTASYRDNATGYNLTSAQMGWFWNQYAPTDDDKLQPYVSPALAASHAGLPPATIITAEYDPLRDEGEQYGAQLVAAGVDADVRRVPGQIHSFMGMLGVAPEATECWDLLADRLAAL